MKRCSTFFLVLSLVFISAAGQHTFFTTKGRQIIDPEGKPFIMRGTNLGNWLVPEGYMFGFKEVNSPRLIDQAITELIGSSEAKKFWNGFLENYITAKDIQFIKSIGMNSIRVPFNYRLFTTESYMGKNDATHGFQLLDKLLNWCRKENLYVVLDMHCAPGGQTGDNIDDGAGYPFLFERKEDQDLLVDIWKRIAAHYANEPLIIGYDLLNEPIAHYFDKEYFNPKLEPLYKRVTAAIREVDTSHIIILGGAQWDSNLGLFGAPFDKKLVYTFHKYWTPPTRDVIRDYIDFSITYNVPVYCGETGENTNSWIDSFRVTLEKENIGWHFWPYKKLNSERGILQFKKPVYYDSIIQYTLSAKNGFADIRRLRPQHPAQVLLSFKAFLENCLFQNCQPNEGYIKALGFRPMDKKTVLADIPQIHGLKKIL